MIKGTVYLIACEIPMKVWSACLWSRGSNFPPEFFPAEIIIPGKDEPETGIPVNFRHGIFHRKVEIPETFSSGKFSAAKNFRWKYFCRKLFPAEKFPAETFLGRNFSNGKNFDGKFSTENQSSSPRTDFSAGQQFEFFKKRLPLTNWARAVTTVFRDLLKN